MKTIALLALLVPAVGAAGCSEEKIDHMYSMALLEAAVTYQERHEAYNDDTNMYIDSLKLSEISDRLAVSSCEAAAFEATLFNK